MLTGNVSSNYKQLSRSLDQVGRKQLPFAFAKTLNQTMKAVGKYTVARTYPRAFDVRNRAFFRAVMFTATQSNGQPRRSYVYQPATDLITVTFSYMQLVPVEYRRLLWFRAEGWSWRKLGRYFGCGSRQVRLRWRDGVVALWEGLR